MYRFSVDFQLGCERLFFLEELIAYPPTISALGDVIFHLVYLSVSTFVACAVTHGIEMTFPPTGMTDCFLVPASITLKIKQFLVNFCARPGSRPVRSPF